MMYLKVLFLFIYYTNALQVISLPGWENNDLNLNDEDLKRHDDDWNLKKSHKQINDLVNFDGLKIDNQFKDYILLNKINSNDDNKISQDENESTLNLSNHPNSIRHETSDNNKQTELPQKSSGIFRKQFPVGDRKLAAEDNGKAGNPLYLTPFIKNGRIKEAQKLSRVRLGHRYGHSFSGLLTVNKTFNSNMFFWLFTATTNSSTAPLLIWLQGGPGGSSLFGLFDETGPFFVDPKGKLKPRIETWTKDHNVVYFDNPVGTGFSFTGSSKGYARTETDVGRDLYEALKQMLTLFPELKQNELFVTGESYAGKYVPALAYTIHKNNPTAELKINLKGVAIGDGLCDPETMMNYGDLLYQVGLIDNNGRQIFKDAEMEIVSHIQAKEWREAFNSFDQLLNGDLTGTTSYYYNVTGLDDYFNFLLQEEPKSYWTPFVTSPKIRREIHVGNLTFHEGNIVEQFLLEDMMQTVKPWIEELLSSGLYRMLFYNGQLDVIVAATLTDNFLSSLKFPESNEFSNASRYIWRDGKDIAGYLKWAGPLAQVVVRDAGHMVPRDQPERLHTLISAFTTDSIEKIV